MPNNRTIKFRIKDFSESILNRYPQKIENIVEENDGWKIQLKIKECLNLIGDNDKNYIFSNDTNNYIEITDMIDYKNKSIIELSKKLGLQKRMKTIEKVNKIIDFTCSFIKFDPDLAQEMSKGATLGRSASETAKLLKGTCGEYSNLALALLRNEQINSKYISGLFINGLKYMNHAWIEFFIEDKRWISCDPQAGTIGLSNKYIRLYEGKDFLDVIPNLMKFEIEIIDNCETTD
jgi:hypothetical protein